MEWEVLPRVRGSAEVVKGQGEELCWKPGSASSAACGETSFS